MAFNEIDQQLIEECTRDIIDLKKIEALIAVGADVNAFEEEYEQCLYEEVLDYYIFEGRERKLNLSNLLCVTELFAEKGLTLNQTPNDKDGFLLNHFRFLPPEQSCIDSFKLLLEKCIFSFEDLDNTTIHASLDLHLGEYYFFEKKREYSEEDSMKYYLELIYWACAYNTKVHPEKCSKNVLQFDWFNRGKNRVELVRENRMPSSVYVEDLETHIRTKVAGWSMKY